MKAEKWRNFTEHDIPCQYFWGETTYTNGFLDVEVVLCFANVDDKHWALVALDFANQCVHVNTSTTPNNYGTKFEYLVDMVPKLLKDYNYDVLKPRFKLMPKWDFKVQKAHQQTG